MSGYETVIGLEVHVELLTESKMFCGCATRFGAPANSQVCPVCLGMPGVLPVINRKAVELAVKTALAFGCELSGSSRFSRKNYFYPDLPKNYQISQYDRPIALGGSIPMEGRAVTLKRIHLEEDAGKLLHPSDTAAYSLVDFNRTGIPLLEIVTEPDLRSPREAEQFLDILKQNLEYLAVSDCTMEEGSLRCDANLSVRRTGDVALGTKTEIKNMNSFKAVRRALEFEAQRHVRILREGGTVLQETRLWNDSLQATETMRTKEEAHDYRYFPEPDLPPLRFDAPQLEILRGQIGELPQARRERFMRRYGLSPYDAGVLTSRRATADFYEACVNRLNQPKLLANWITGDLAAALRERGLGIASSPVTPEFLVELLELCIGGKITSAVAKDILREIFETGLSPSRIAGERNLLQIQDEEAIAAVVRDVIREHSQAVKDFLGGRKQAEGFLVGQVMRRTGGKADPRTVLRLLQRNMPHQESSG